MGIKRQGPSLHSVEADFDVQVDGHWLAFEGGGFESILLDGFDALILHFEYGAT
jgi:hypothetical protein